MQAIHLTLSAKSNDDSFTARVSLYLYLFMEILEVVSMSSQLSQRMLDDSAYSIPKTASPPGSLHDSGMVELFTPLAL
jgi:hypothetical protein